jgi:hypothetical protein
VYIGLRVTEYTPHLTKEDADSGFNGLTVVRARRKVTTPEMAVATPIAQTDGEEGAGNAKIDRWCGSRNSHISKPVTSAWLAAGFLTPDA